MRRLTGIAILFLLSAGAAFGADPDPVLQAMRDEMARSVKELSMENLERPYFVAYRVDDIAWVNAEAAFGDLAAADQDRERRLTVEVRVGDPSLDNTNFVSVDMTRVTLGGSAPETLPIEDDYLPVRRAIWLATDEAYKEAVSTLARKRAALQNRTRTEELPDFAARTPAQVTEAPPGPPPDLATATGLTRELSQLFRSMPAVSSGTVRLTARTVYSRYVNSEGSSFTRSLPDVRLVALIEGFAADGLPLRDYYSAFGRSLADLPTREVLKKEIEGMGARLTALRDAPLLDTYNGPLLAEGPAAAQLLARIFLSPLAATRTPVSDSPQLGMMLGMLGTSLADKLGARVFPASISVDDDPTARRLGETPLLGGYSVDDDGVPAARTPLVTGGVLKSLLATRNPARGALQSTGNRRGEGPAPSNVILTAQGGLKDQQLREKLLALVKERGLEYGIILRRISDPVLCPEEVDPMAAIMRMARGGGQESKTETALWVVKLHPDGREEPLRNVQISDLGVGAFKDIVATSAASQVVTMPWERDSPFAGLGALATMFGAATAVPPLVSVASPALLFEEVTLKKPEGEMSKPPLMAHPYFAR